MSTVTMTKTSKTVDHIGVIQEISQHQVTVSILNLSACASCHAQGSCTTADSMQKEIIVNNTFHNYQIGQKVKVQLKQSLGFKALFLGYLLPFIIILLLLITLSALSFSEGKVVLLSLAVLPIYYYFLYLFRHRIAKQFHFEIEPI